MGDTQGVKMAGSDVASKGVVNSEVVEHVEVGVEDAVGEASSEENMANKGSRDLGKALNEVCGAPSEGLASTSEVFEEKIG